MTFAAPFALILLAAVPYFAWLGRPRTPYRRGRDLVSLVLRLAIALLFILGLAGAQLVLAADRLAVLFLVDFSDSMGAVARQAAVDYVNAALESMGPDDQAGVILFGADALVEQPLSPVRELGEVYSTPLTLHTNIEQAVRLALALYPPDMARRMVILSDGQATLGDAEAAARLAGASGVQIDFVPFQRQPAPEILVTNVSTPAILDEGQIFDLSLTLESNAATAAEVTVMAAGQVAHQQQIDLVAGSQNFVLSLQANRPGFTDFRVLVEPVEEDTFYQNNVLSSFSRVTGPPRVLVARTDPRDTADLVAALQATGVAVDEVEPGALPVGLAPLGVYESVILVDVPASRLSLQRMKVLQSYVRDLGGGLVVIGGPHSYGVGGYFQTPLEETLPVEMQIRDQERMPQVALVFAIDRSGSMARTEPTAGFTHLDLAKEAVIRSIDLLGPLDAVGVIGFDSSAFWVVPLQPATSNRQEIQAQVGMLVPGGGTSIHAAVQAISEVLPQYDAPLKHVILLSDGAANPRSVVDMAKAMHEEEGITTSVVAIGEGYMDWIERLAEETEGRFHFAPDVSTIPAIFTAETALASRSYIIEETFYPTLRTPSEMLSGISQVPPLLGYVAATPKSTAQTLLITGQEDPLLAAWQYGLGRAVAWTSDTTSRWAREWLGWDSFGRLWSQIVRWTITEGAGENVEVTVETRGEESMIRVDALGQDERYLNGLDLEARVVDPELGARMVPLRQVAPGRYEGAFVPGEEGAYFVGVAGSAGGGEDAPAVMQTTGWVLSYSPEYRTLESDTRLLEQVAALADGRELEQPGQAFEHNLAAQQAPVPLWPWLLLAAAVLLPLDVAVRRLVVTRRDWERLRSAMGEMISGGPASAQVSTEHSERFAQLHSAKTRASEMAQTSEPEVTGDIRTPARRPDDSTEDTEALAGPPAGRVPLDKPSRPKPRPIPQEEDDDANIAARLLKKKRRQEGDE